jgi:uroporphyrinogen decarboxylase
MELLLLGDPGLRDELLAKCHDFFVKEVRAYRDNGADVIVYSNPFGSTDFVPLKYFTDHSLPWIEKDVKAVGTDGLVYYAGMARFNKVIEVVRERTGIGVWYVSPLDDLAESKRIIGNRGLCCGVIDDISLIKWSPDEIRREVKRLLAAGMPGGRFLFGTGVMPYGIPEQNIRIMLDAAYEYGRLDRG